MRSKGDGTKYKGNREKLEDLLERERERERERRDSGQREGDGTRDKIKREKRAKEKENMMFDCWVYIDVQASWPEHTYW